MNKLAIAVALILSAPAFADNPHNSNPAPVDVNQDQVQLQGQDQTLVNGDTIVTTGDTSVTGGAATVSINETHPDNIKIRSVPWANAPDIASANPCGVGGSFGVSGVGFGVTGGGTKESFECRLWDSVRILEASGEHVMAMKLVCVSELAKLANYEYCKGYRSAPKGWEIVDEPYVDMTQFNKKD